MKTEIRRVCFLLFFLVFAMTPLSEVRAQSASEIAELRKLKQEIEEQTRALQETIRKAEKLQSALRESQQATTSQREEVRKAVQKEVKDQIDKGGYQWWLGRRGPRLNGGFHLGLRWTDDTRGGAKSKLGFDPSLVRFGLIGEATENFSYRFQAEFAGDDNKVSIRDAYVIWRPRYEVLKSSFENLYLSQNASLLRVGRWSDIFEKERSGFARLSPSIHPRIVPPASSSSRVNGAHFTLVSSNELLAIRPYIKNGLDSADTRTNSQNDFRYGTNIYYSPFYKWPLRQVDEWDSKNSPFNVLLMGSVEHGRETFQRTSTDVVLHPTETNYYQTTAMAIWRGASVWYAHHWRDSQTIASKKKGALPFDNDGQSQVITTAYAFPLGKYKLVPFFRWAEVGVDDASISGAARRNEYTFGFNWYINGENVAIKSNFVLDKRSKTDDRANRFETVLQYLF